MTAIVSLVLAFAGLHMMSVAASIAIRRKTNVWTAARMEAFGGALLVATAFLLIISIPA